MQNFNQQPYFVDDEKLKMVDGTIRRKILSQANKLKTASSYIRSGHARKRQKVNGKFVKSL